MGHLLYEYLPYPKTSLNIDELKMQSLGVFLMHFWRVFDQSQVSFVISENSAFDETYSQNLNSSVTDGRTDRPTDGRTDIPFYRDARTHLKIVFCSNPICILPEWVIFNHFLIIFKFHTTKFTVKCSKNKNGQKFKMSKKHCKKII